MKKLLKWPLRIVISLVVLLLVVIFGVILFLNPLVRAIAETVVPPMTKTSITLGESDISLLGLRVALGDLQIGNPEGFKTDYALRFKKIVLDVDQWTVLNDVIYIDEVTVDGASVMLEQGITTSNLMTIVDNLKNMSAADTAKKIDESAQPETAAKKASAKKIVIRKLTLSNAMVSFSLKGVMGGMSVPVPLPTITLTDIGGKSSNKSGEEGASLAEILDHIISAILNSAAEVSAGVKDIAKGLQDVGGKAVETLGTAGGEAGKSAEKLLNEAGKGTGDAIKSGTESAKDVLKSVKDLF